MFAGGKCWQEVWLLGCSVVSRVAAGRGVHRSIGSRIVLRAGRSTT